MYNPSEQITVTTANTQMGKAIRSGGLQAVANSDVLLLQEVQMPPNELAEHVKELGLLAVSIAGHFGLAIAIKPEHKVTDSKKVTLQKQGPLGRAIGFHGSERWDDTKFRLRGRGLLVVALKTAKGSHVTVATTHPTVPIKFLSRRKQINAAADALADVTDPLVLAGDMNHWPGPGRLDRKMRGNAHLAAVNLGTVPTFDVARNNYAWLGKLSQIGLNPNGQLDAMLYRGAIHPNHTELVDISTDHQAISTTFTLARLVLA
ncbi:MAG: Metal-dependent hydrolase, endonuclease/exonuclease/phosphatase family [Candidatus Saccharibacteria bacterium]|nr:Metal-dependent hydrolase, endonuclease/exonuclease/phosphatase family [Candidatus Saccharibacteria bacterium]